MYIYIYISPLRQLQELQKDILEKESELKEKKKDDCPKHSPQPLLNSTSETSQAPDICALKVVFSLGVGVTFRVAGGHEEGADGGEADEKGRAGSLYIVLLLIYIYIYIFGTIYVFIRSCRWRRSRRSLQLRLPAGRSIYIYIYIMYDIYIYIHIIIYCNNIYYITHYTILYYTIRSCDCSPAAG